MSFKDDFLEAWRSVKRDFFRDTEYTAPESTTQKENVQQPDTQWEQPYQAESAPRHYAAQGDNTPAYNGEEYYPTDQSDEVILDAFQQASALPNEVEDADEYYENADDADGLYPSDATPYREYDPEAIVSEMLDTDHRSIVDSFDGSGIYSDEKTIISKNTIIRGTLTTDDSVRLLGQVMGDIECKSNIVVAGKVRGNTIAANAYLFDAQVDGDVRCDDIINISNDAWVLGNIRAQQAEIDGKIKGNIEIRHMVSIGATSSVLGDISADELEIKRGAFVNGQIMMYSPSRDVLDHFEQFDDK